MAHDPNGERELTLRELTALFKGFRDLMAERDRRYDDRFTSLTDRQARDLAALEKQTAAAFTASERAKEKAEEAQNQYNVRSNEFRSSLDDQNKHMMPRAESEASWRANRERTDQVREEMRLALDASKKDAAEVHERLRMDIIGLRESRSQQAGHQEQRTEHREQIQWMIPLLVTIGLFLLGLLFNVAIFFAVRVLPQQ